MRALAALTAALALLVPSPAAAFEIERILRPAAGGAPQSVEVVAGQVLVKFAAGVDKQAAAGAAAASVVADFPGGWTLLELPPGMSTASGLGVFSGQLGVSQADGNRVYRLTTTPNDPGVAGQYALTRVNAFAAWDRETGETGDVIIAMIDSGIQPTQADLAAKVAAAPQARHFHPTTGAANNDTPVAACNHGTRTASVAAAAGNNGVGIAGIAYGSKIKLLSLRVFDTLVPSLCTASCGGASCVTTDTSLAAAVNHAITLTPANEVVINMSVGGAGACNFGGTLQTALSNAVTAGIPVIISAGNDGGAVNNPANCASSTAGTGIMPVGASDSNDSIASFSSRGAELAANGVIAPGVDVLVDDVGCSSCAVASGTSFSAPHVAGVAALLLSRSPTLTARQVQSIITGTTANVGIATLGNSSGGGRLDAGRAVKLAVTGSAGSADLDNSAVAYPNPFRPGTHSTVTFTIPRGVEGNTRKIKIFTTAGEFVREVSALTWDGKNAGGVLVASGVYLFTITLGEKVLNGRVAVIR